ncbi:MAG: sodium/proline symporter [Kofleriaceae bacterium]
MTAVAITFLACLACFALIGAASVRRSQPTTVDYLVAGRSVSPWLTGLSSAATNNSGFMFIGLFGFAYRYGVQAIWLQLGWILGDVAAWLWVHRRVREYSAEHDVASVPRLLGTAPGGRVSRPIMVVAGLLTFVFLSGYAAAQLKAGSATLTGMFGWAPSIGVVLGAVIVVTYCFAGGLRASIWTDAAQAIVMLVALLALLGYAVASVGGPVALERALAAADPALVDWVPRSLRFGFAVYFVGFVFGGLGAVGQPHILVRSMAVRSPASIALAGRVYFAWYVPFSIAAVTAALYARVLLPDLLVGVEPGAAAMVAEQSLPAVATLLLPKVLLGVLLAGVFAATMSTADSQILSCSAAVTQDVWPRLARSVVASKLATLTVAALATLIALWASADVFGLVLGAWSALGAALGPVLLIRLARLPLPTAVGLAMMAAGLATVTWWSRGPYAGAAFELLPGFVVPLAIYGVFLAAAPRVMSASRRR